MKFKTETITQSNNILANDHYVLQTYDCSLLSSLAADEIIKAGTIIPANDNTAVGVLLNDVILTENPNGTIIIHGFIDKGKLPEAPNENVNLPMIKFID